jgi:threonine synthase
VRILEIFSHDRTPLGDMLSSISISDDETSLTIRQVHHDTGYLLDPHGAIGYLALKRWQESHPGDKGYFLETAHPVKFPESVEKATGQSIEIPPHVKPIMEGIKQSTPIPAEYEALAAFLQRFE